MVRALTVTWNSRGYNLFRDFSRIMVNKDLAMMVGYESVEELNEHVKSDTESESKLRDRHMLDHKITLKLFEANEFEPPKSMAKYSFNSPLY